MLSQTSVQSLISRLFMNLRKKASEGCYDQIDYHEHWVFVLKKNRLCPTSLDTKNSKTMIDETQNVTAETNFKMLACINSQFYVMFRTAKTVSYNLKKVFHLIFFLSTSWSKTLTRETIYYVPNVYKSKEPSITDLITI